jgi:hypothetical protein
MEIIIQKNDFKIGQDNKMFTIFFNSYSEPLIRSITKTNILLGATTTEKYNSIIFKATKVQTMYEYQKDIEREYGTPKMPYNSVLKMTYDLVNQLNYLINHSSMTFLGYSPENVIVVDKNKYIYLSNEYLLTIQEDENIIITCPFSQNDFFISPELLVIKDIPSLINYKVTYFSFGCLLLYGLLGHDDNFDNDNLLINALSIKNTSLYWLLKRCLVKNPQNRCILFI